MIVERVSVSGGSGTINVGGKIVRPELQQSLRIALATGQLRLPLSATLRPLLDLLADGDYELHGPEPLADGVELVPTGDWPPSDEARVTYYRTAIRTHHKPAAVLLHAGEQVFIVDGHHKIAAYRAEGAQPTTVRLAVN